MTTTAMPTHLIRYSAVAIVLHWIVAILIIANITLGWAANVVADDYVRPLIDTHKSIGITVLGLVIMRLLWRLSHVPPPLPTGYAAWERRASHITHALFYVLMFAVPIMGWMHDSAWKAAPTHPMRWFNLFEWPRMGFIMQLEPGLKESLHTLFGRIHASLGFFLAALVLLHVVAALKHQFIDRERELQRMSF